MTEKQNNVTIKSLKQQMFSPDERLMLSKYATADRLVQNSLRLLLHFSLLSSNFSLRSLNFIYLSPIVTELVCVSQKLLHLDPLSLAVVDATQCTLNISATIACYQSFWALENTFWSLTAELSYHRQRSSVSADQTELFIMSSKWSLWLLCSDLPKLYHNRGVTSRMKTERKHPPLLRDVLSSDSFHC